MHGFRCLLASGGPPGASIKLQKNIKKHKFRHGFHCILASGGRPAHRAKVALNTESYIVDDDAWRQHFRKINKQLVFGAILTNGNPKKHEKITKASNDPHPLFSREVRRIFFLRALLFLAKDGGQHTRTSGSGFATRRRATHMHIRLQLRQEEAGNTRARQAPTWPRGGTGHEL